LTPRELSVLKLIAEGMHNKEIATTLSITEETVHSHLKKIYAKWNVNDRQGAVNVAVRRGIIHVG
jgi:DNA-binding NarL/FixJ family response regulator